MATSAEKKRARSRAAQNMRRKASRALASLERDFSAGKVDSGTFERLSARFNSVIAENTYSRTAGGYGVASTSEALKRAERAFNVYNAQAALRAERLSKGRSEAFREGLRVQMRRESFRVEMEAALRGDASTIDPAVANMFMRQNKEVWLNYDKSYRLDRIAEVVGGGDLESAFNTFVDFYNGEGYEGEDFINYARDVIETSPAAEKSKWYKERRRSHKTDLEVTVERAREKVRALQEKHRRSQG